MIRIVCQSHQIISPPVNHNIQGVHSSEQLQSKTWTLFSVVTSVYPSKKVMIMIINYEEKAFLWVKIL